MNRYLLPYEYQQFSQHGEDGIIDKMIGAIRHCNQFVLEIGFGDGMQNMSRRLIELGWSGIGVDAADTTKLPLPPRFEFRSCWVVPADLAEIVQGTPRDLDFFSLDIDSFDFEVAQWMLEHGYRPKTVCLEFNHRFGPTVQASFPYAVPLGSKRIYNKKHFHGVSLAKYRALWQGHGYEFFGFDSSCVNVFFYDPQQVNSLAELPLNSYDILPCTQDLVFEQINQNHFWQSWADQIYQAR